MRYGKRLRSSLISSGLCTNRSSLNRNTVKRQKERSWSISSQEKREMTDWKF